MEVIHWAGLKPAPSDFKGAAQAVRGVVHLRALLRALVRAVLEGYPWEGRSEE